MALFLVALFSMAGLLPVLPGIFKAGSDRLTLRFFRKTAVEGSDIQLFKLLGLTFSVAVFVYASFRLIHPVFDCLAIPAWLQLPLLGLLLLAVLLFGALILPSLAGSLFPGLLIRATAALFLPLYVLFKPFTGLFRGSGQGQPLSLPDYRTSDGSPVTPPLWPVDPERPGKKEAGGKVEKEIILFRNALDFSKVKLREIMVPRNEISVLDINSDVEALRQRFIDTGFSRILFFEGNKDNIVGYVHVSAIFMKARSIKPYLKNVLIVPETMAANRLLAMFIREHRSIALVVDEFGGTSGLVTTEDILEEIFGEIEDEHDTRFLVEKQLSDRQYLFSGRMEIDTLNEKYSLGFPESPHYETLAGFILFHHESIPDTHSTIQAGKYSFKILKATKTKIELVKLVVSDV